MKENRSYCLNLKIN